MQMLEDQSPEPKSIRNNTIIYLTKYKNKKIHAFSRIAFMCAKTGTVKQTVTFGLAAFGNHHTSPYQPNNIHRCIKEHIYIRQVAAQGAQSDLLFWTCA